MTPPDPTDLDLDLESFDDVVDLLARTELAMPTTLTAPRPARYDAPPAPVETLAAAIRRDADEAWSLAVAFLGDEEAAWEAVCEGFLRLGRAGKSLTRADSLHAQSEALLEVARLLSKSGSLPEVRGGSLPPETRLALMLQAAFPGAELGAAEPAVLRRALIAAYPQPGHAQGDELCALLADEVLGGGSPGDADSLAKLRAKHPASAKLIEARYQETVEVPLLVLPRVDELIAHVEGQLARAARQAEAVGALQLQTAVNCSYCHDRLRRAEAAFCSSCLAPHHADCFTNHGRCCAPGCGETRLVQPREASGRRRRWLPWLAAGLVGLGAAAWTGVEISGQGLLAQGEPVLSAEYQPEPEPRFEVDPELLREALALSEVAQREREALERERAAVLAQLDSITTDLHFEEEPLLECLAYLRTLSNTNLVVSSSARELCEDEMPVVSLRLKQVSLRNALILILDAAGGGLGFRVDAGVIVIESVDDYSAGELELQAYPVQDLLDGTAQAQGGVRVADAEQLIELLESALYDGEGSIEFGYGALVVRKSAREHRAIQDLLRLLRTGESPPREVPAWERELRAALEQPVALNAPEKTLREVTNTIQEAVGHPLVLDSAIDPEARVSLTLSATPLKDVLRLLGEQAGLTFRLRNEAIVLVHPRDAVRRSDCRYVLYDTHDLQSLLEADHLAEVVTNSTGEERWDDPAQLTVVGEHLLVLQTEELHRAVATALAQLRVSHMENTPRENR